jgi:hypothetical protein
VVAVESEFTEHSKPHAKASKSIQTHAESKTQRIVKDFEKETKDLPKVPSIPEKQKKDMKKMKAVEGKATEKAGKRLDVASQKHTKTVDANKIQENHDGTGVPGTPQAVGKAATSAAGEHAAQAVHSRFAKEQKTAQDKKAAAQRKARKAKNDKKMKNAVAQQKVWDKRNADERAEEEKEEKQKAEDAYYDKIVEEEGKKKNPPEKDEKKGKKSAILSFLQAASALRK